MVVEMYGRMQLAPLVQKPLLRACFCRVFVANNS
jgi:hypothetical protein